MTTLIRQAKGRVREEDETIQAGRGKVYTLENGSDETRMYRLGIRPWEI